MIARDSVGCWKRRLIACARVVGLAVGLQALGLAILLPAAEARIGERLAGIGAELMRIEGANSNGEPRSLALNGVTLHFRSNSTDREVRTVLDHFDRLCRSRAGFSLPPSGAEALAKLKENGSSFLDGVFRNESETEGVVACVDTAGKVSLNELVDRLQTFAATGDLSAIGELRYGLARRVGDRTAVLTMWTEGETPILKMFPAHGDAPGSDLAGIPRAPGLRRLLSAWENGRPYAIAAYTAPTDEGERLLAFYRAELSRLGWVLDQKVPDSKEGAFVFTARRQNQTLAIRSTLRDGQIRLSLALLS